MKIFPRIAAFLMIFTLLCPSALAAKATPTPPPTQIEDVQIDPPEQIRKMLDIAYAEWQALNGKRISEKNKYTEWRGKGYSFEWCAGYVTWVMMEAGIPMNIMGEIRDAAGDDDHLDMQGVYHVKEATPGKFLRAYQIMDRATMIPQKGFLVVYGCSYNKTIHTAFVYDVEPLGGGRYRLTTLEGNVGDSIKMYIRDYDMNVQVNTNSRKSTNLTEVPEDERTPIEGNVDYSITQAKPSTGASAKYPYYVNRFLMPWVPGDPTLATATPAPTAEPTPEPTPEPTAEPIVQTVTALTPPPAVTKTPAPTDAPVIPQAPTATPTLAPTFTPEPAPQPTMEAVLTFPCQGRDGQCPYITRNADDAFCRVCDRNDNGVEDTKE